MKYFICYDITSPTRIHKIGKLLETKGLRVQKSFFCCDMSEFALASLLNDMRALINKKNDKISCYPICERCFSKIKTVGKQVDFLEPSYYIL